MQSGLRLLPLVLVLVVASFNTDSTEKSDSATRTRGLKRVRSVKSRSRCSLCIDHSSAHEISYRHCACKQWSRVPSAMLLLQSEETLGSNIEDQVASLNEMTGVTNVKVHSDLGEVSNVVDLGPARPSEQMKQAQKGMDAAALEVQRVNSNLHKTEFDRRKLHSNIKYQVRSALHKLGDKAHGQLALLPPNATGANLTAAVNRLQNDVSQKEQEMSIEKDPAKQRVNAANVRLLQLRLKLAVHQKKLFLATGERETDIERDVRRLLLQVRYAEWKYRLSQATYEDSIAQSTTEKSLAKQKIEEAEKGLAVAAGKVPREPSASEKADTVKIHVALLKSRMAAQAGKRIKKYASRISELQQELLQAQNSTLKAVLTSKLKFTKVQVKAAVAEAQKLQDAAEVASNNITKSTDPEILQLQVSTRKQIDGLQMARTIRQQARTKIHGSLEYSSIQALKAIQNSRQQRQEVLDAVMKQNSQIEKIASAQLSKSDAETAEQVNAAKTKLNHIKRESEQERNKIKQVAGASAGKEETVFEKDAKLLQSTTASKQGVVKEKHDARKLEKSKDKRLEHLQSKEELDLKQKSEAVQNAAEKAKLKKVMSVDDRLVEASVQETEMVKANLPTSEIHLQQSSRIMSTKDAFLCIRKFFDSLHHLTKFQYMQCNKNAWCTRPKSSLRCVCKEGYRGNGHECVATDCGALEGPRDGILQCLNGTTSGQTCLQSCQTGYSLSGPTEIKCLASGAWSNLKAVKSSKCVPVTCKDAAPVANRFQECTGTKYGDTCNFKCKNGYELRGNSLLTCRAVPESLTGKWIGEHEGQAQCVPIDCGNPIVPVGATASCDGTTFDKSCSFSCAGGDKIEGATNQRCRYDGTWSGVPIVCEALKCSTLLPPSHGDLSCSGQGVDNKCTLKCMEGYQIEGASYRVCRRTVAGSKAIAMWTGSPAICKRTSCPKSEPLVDGVQTCGGHASGQSCLSECNKGFTLSGSYTRTCKLSGKWSGRQAKCVPVDCGKHAELQGGNAVCEGTAYRHKCRFICDKGRQLIGVDQRVCQKGGYWSSKRPECRSIKCEARANPVAGRLSCDGSTIGDRCTASCNHGYIVEGQAVSQCEQSGKWTHPEAKCTKKVCPKLEAPMLGKLKCDSYTYGGSCGFSCDEGYEIDGPTPVRRCLASGRWSGSPLTCKKKNCGLLGAPLNGEKDCPDGTIVGKKCEFKCDVGFTLSPAVANTRTCAASGEWIGESATCVPMDCGRIFAQGIVANCKAGTTVGKTCSLQCSLGYEPLESSTTECSLNGTWTGPLKCVKKLCQIPMKPKHGKVTCESGHAVGSACKFGCNKGYRLSGSHIRVCDERGIFSGSPTKCEHITCPGLESPKGGVMKCSKASSTIAPGEVCKFSCDFGFSFRGSAKRECNEVGQWTGENAACDKRRCDPPQVLPGCNVRCADALEFGKNCSISARSGYQLSSNKPVENITCTGRGEWTKADTRCNIARCPALPNPGLGRIICTRKDLQGSKCGLQCDSNTVRTGIQTATCGMDNAWTAGALKCGPAAARMTKYQGMADVEPVFNFFSETGNVGVRLESLSPPKAKNVFIDFISHASNTTNSWLVGLMGDNSLSFCYGSKAEHKCALRFENTGNVNFLGATYFHGNATAKDQQVPVASLTDLYGDEFIEELEDDESLLLHDALSQQRPSYDLRIGSSKLYGASWVSDGNVGVQIESRDRQKYHATYTEFRNQGLSDTFSVGMQNDTTLHIGYGLLGTMNRGQSMSISNKNEVSVVGDAIFRVQPSYFESKSTKLNLKAHVAAPKAVTFGNRVKVKAESATNIREIPQMTETAVGLANSAEPLVTYHSADDIGMKIESKKEAYLSWKSRTVTWRMGVQADGNFYLSFSNSAGSKRNVAIKIDTKNKIHFYGNVVFQGQVLRTFR